MKRNLSWFILGLITFAAMAAVYYPPTGGGGGTDVSVGGTYYVSSTGSDTAAGTVSAPLATTGQAYTNLGRFGTIIVRGGDYFNQKLNLTNAGGLTIRNFQGEVPRFYYGVGITTNSFTLLSNGIYTTTMTSSFSNNLYYTTNFWGTWPAPLGVLLYQTNVFFGTNAMGNYQQSMVTAREQMSNRCNVYPLRQATSIPNMIATNGLWFASGNTLYVKFAVSNVTGGVFINSTNLTDCFAYGGTDATELRVKGIQTYFAWVGIDFSRMGYGEFTSCTVIGSGRSGFYGDSGCNASVRVTHCVGQLSQLEGFECGSATIATRGPLADVVQIDCLWSDNNIESCAARGNTVQTVIGGSSFGNFANFGWIDDGSASTYIASQSYSNLVSGWQIGNSAVGSRSYQKLMSSAALGNSVGLQVDDANNFVMIQNGVFDNYATTPVNISANPTTHRGVDLNSVIGGGTYASGGFAAPFFNGGGLPAANYSDEWISWSPTVPISPNSMVISGSATTPTFGGPTIWARGGSADIKLYNDGALATFKSNTLAMATITLGASPFNYTNTTTGNQFITIGDQTTGALNVNGAAVIATMVTAPASVSLQPNEYITLTYTGTPKIRSKPQ